MEGRYLGFECNIKYSALYNIYRNVRLLAGYWGLRISANNQISVCLSRHIILSLKTDTILICYLKVFSVCATYLFTLKI